MLLSIYTTVYGKEHPTYVAVFEGFVLIWPSDLSRMRVKILRDDERRVWVRAMDSGYVMGPFPPYENVDDDE